MFVPPVSRTAGVWWPVASAPARPRSGSSQTPAPAAATATARRRCGFSSVSGTGGRINSGGDQLKQTANKLTEWVTVCVVAGTVVSVYYKLLHT